MSKKQTTGMPIVIFTLLKATLYSLTLDPATWVILSEIFPDRIREATMSLAALMLRIENFSLTFHFQ
ncbi:MAG: MFS transporter [Bacteroidota bacterium]